MSRLRDIPQYEEEEGKVRKRGAEDDDPFQPPEGSSPSWPDRQTSPGRPNMWRRLLETTAILAAATMAVRGGVVKYDQSQTGDYNVHLDLKNIEVLAFLDDSSSSSFGGEYDYDYGELTLKPPASSGSPSSNGSTTESPVVSSTEKGEDGSASTGQEAESPPATTPAGPTKTARRCGAGFYRDPNGRCRRLRRPGPGIKLSGLLNQAKNKITVSG